MKSEDYSFFDNWPVDLDILLSSSDDEQRILAASRMAELGSRFANYPHRDDALKVLEFLAQSNISDPLRASVIGAWNELEPKRCPQWIIDLAKPGMPVYSASVARAIVAGTVTMHPDIFKGEIGRQMSSTIDSYCFMLPKLEEAWEKAQGSEEKMVIENAVADIGNNPSNQNDRLKIKLTGRITTKFTLFASA